MERLAARPNAYRAAQEAPNTDARKRGNSEHIEYKKEIQLATINCSGIGITEWETNIKLIGENHIDILALQETHLNQNSTLKKNKFLYMFASDFIPKPMQPGQLKGKGKGRGKGKKGATWEHAGVGFCIAPKVANAIEDIFQISSRLFTLTLRAKGRKIAITSAYAPQSGRPMAEKEKFYKQLAG